MFIVCLQTKKKTYVILQIVHIEEYKYDGEKRDDMLPFPSKVPVKSKGQRHILSSRIVLSLPSPTVTFADILIIRANNGLLRATAWIAKKWDSRAEEPFVFGVHSEYFWGGRLEGEKSTLRQPFFLHLLRMNAGLLFYVHGKNITFLGEKL